jgi:Fe-S-cluster containining protein
MVTYNTGTGACDGCNGRCCYYSIIPVTGYDAYVICRTQHLAPEYFLVYVEESEPSSMGFRLQKDASTFLLALNKQRTRRKSKPCVFLLTLPDGYQRCGIYANRPLVCQTFPTTLHNGSVDIRADAMCPKGSWNLASMDLATWRTRLVRSDIESNIYARVVSRWNAMVDANAAGAPYSIFHYFAYLINAYTRLAELRRRLPEHELIEIAHRRGEPASEEPGEMSWEHFVGHIDDVLNAIGAD